MGTTAEGVTSPGAFAITLAPGAALTQGTRVTYTAAVTNNTAQSAQVIVVVGFDSSVKVDVVPAGCVKLGQNLLECPAAPLAAGATLSYVPEVTPGSAGPITNGASVSTFDPVTGITTSQNSVADDESVAPGQTDAQVTGSSNQGSPLVGAPFTYTFQVKNNGPFATVGGVSFADDLPTSLTFRSVTTDRGSCTGGSSVTCALGDLAVGAQATIGITVSANVATTIVNTATVSLTAPQVDRSPANNAVTVTVTSK